MSSKQTNKQTQQTNRGILVAHVLQTTQLNYFHMSERTQVLISSCLTSFTISHAWNQSPPWLYTFKCAFYCRILFYLRDQNILSQSSSDLIKFEFKSIVLFLKYFSGWRTLTRNWNSSDPHNSLETQTAHNYNFKVYPVVRGRTLFRRRKRALRWNNWESQTARQIHKFRKLPQYRSLSSEASCHISVDDNKTKQLQ